MGAWSKSEAQRWLDVLDERWSKLQAAALGPTLTPTVPKDVLLFVANEWTSFRAWRATPTSASDAFRAQLGDFARRANTVRAELLDAGARVPDELPLNAEDPPITGPYVVPDQLAREALETAKRAANRAADVAESYGRGLGQGVGFGGVLVAAAALYLWTRKGNR